MTKLLTRRGAELAVIDAALEFSGLPLYSGARLDSERTLEHACRTLVALGPRRAPVGRLHPQTSLEAAEWMSRRAGDVVGRVFKVIYLSDGLTADQVQQRLSGSHQSISPRVTDLRNKGWIVDSGRRRRTRSGRKAIVWEASAMARRAVPHVKEWSFT
jgi:hypothetical protein